jgi:hypothetical protein
MADSIPFARVKEIGFKGVTVIGRVKTCSRGISKPLRVHIPQMVSFGCSTFAIRKSDSNTSRGV